MKLTTSIKNRFNRLFRPLNIRVDTWTADDAETQRLERLQAQGVFDKPTYAEVRGIRDFDAATVCNAYKQFLPGLQRLNDPKSNRVDYSADNSFYTTPDSEILYLIVRALQPRRIVEVGCGHSTRVTRQAIIDGDLAATLTAIDPHPRADIAGLADRLELSRLEELEDTRVFDELGEDDILFIDSSHQAFVGNDVANLFCRIIPRLASGVVVQVHDIFLPYEYPPRLAFSNSRWGEQYVLHAMLLGSDCEILWPGHYVQRSRQDIVAALPFLRNGTAQSFWFRWKPTDRGAKG